MSHSRSAEAEGAGGAGWGAAGLLGGCADSRTRIGEPCETLSPSLILSSFTTPAPGEGISIVALSDSSVMRSEEHTSELQSRLHLVCRLLLEKKKNFGAWPSTSQTYHAGTRARSMLAATAP